MADEGSSPDERSAFLDVEHRSSFPSEEIDERNGNNNNNHSPTNSSHTIPPNQGQYIFNSSFDPRDYLYDDDEVEEDPNEELFDEAFLAQQLYSLNAQNQGRAINNNNINNNNNNYPALAPLQQQQQHNLNNNNLNPNAAAPVEGERSNRYSMYSGNGPSIANRSSFRFPIWLLYSI